MKFEVPDKNFLFHQNHLKFSFFIVSTLTVTTLSVVLYITCKHTKSRTLITILALYQLHPKNQIVDALSPK